MQLLAPLLQSRPKWLLEQIDQTRPEQQPYRGCPPYLGDTFDRSEFEQAPQAQRRRPEFIDANFAPMRISGQVSVKVPQRLMDALPLVTGGQRFELSVGQLEVQ